jgi:hypothetical protein
MKSLLLLSIFCFVFVVAASGQSTRVEPVPEAPVVIMRPGDFENIRFPASLDRFGDLNKKDLKFRVDRYLSTLSANNKTVEYVIVLDRSSKVLATRVRWFSNYLRSKKIAVHRFSFGFARTDDGLTELWLSPNTDVKVPQYEDVVIIGADDSEALDKFLKLP